MIQYEYEFHYNLMMETVQSYCSHFEFTKLNFTFVEGKGRRK